MSGSRSHAVSRSSPHQIGRGIVRREDAGRRDGEVGTSELRPGGLDGEKILTSSNWQRERTREEAGRGNGEAGASEMPVTGLDGKMGGGWWCAPQYNAAASAPPLAAGHPCRPRTTTGLLADACWPPPRITALPQSFHMVNRRGCRDATISAPATLPPAALPIRAGNHTSPRRLTQLQLHYRRGLLTSRPSPSSCSRSRLPRRCVCCWHRKRGRKARKRENPGEKDRSCILSSHGGRVWWHLQDSCAPAELKSILLHSHHADRAAARLQSLIYGKRELGERRWWRNGGRFRERMN